MPRTTITSTDLLGILESQRGNSAQAIADLRKAADLNPQNLRAIYQLAEETERQSATNSDSEFQALIQKILAAQPDNLAALLELSRIAAKRGDAATLKSAVAQISARSSAWPPEVQHQLAVVQSAAAGPDLHAAATQTTFLRNVLVRVPEYRLSLTAIKAAPGEEAEPFTHFLRLESPVFKPAAADTSLAFNPQPVANLRQRSLELGWSDSARKCGRACCRRGEWPRGEAVQRRNIPFPGGASSAPPQPEGIIPLDFNYDFKTDLVLAGAGGVRLLRAGQSEFVQRRNRADQTSEVRRQRALHRGVGGGHRSRWRSRYRARGQQRRPDRPEK